MQTMGKFLSKKPYEKMTMYEQVYTILEESPECRNSDKKLYREYWRRQGIVEIEYPRKELLNLNLFIEVGGNPKSLHICRQKIQQEHKNLVAEGKMKVQDSLLPAAQVAKFREDIEQEKGTHVYREKTLTLFNTENQ